MAICGLRTLQFVEADGHNIIEVTKSLFVPAMTTVRCGQRPQHLKSPSFCCRLMSQHLEFIERLFVNKPNLVVCGVKWESFVNQIDCNYCRVKALELVVYWAHNSYSIRYCSKATVMTHNAPLSTITRNINECKHYCQTDLNKCHLENLCIFQKANDILTTV